MSLLAQFSAILARLRGTDRSHDQIRARQLRYLDGLKPPSEETAANCEHRLLRPTWDNLTDIGNESRSTAFLCEACHQTFTPAEAAAHAAQAETA